MNNERGQKSHDILGIKLTEFDNMYIYVIHIRIVFII